MIFIGIILIVLGIVVFIVIWGNAVREGTDLSTISEREIFDDTFKMKKKSFFISVLTESILIPLLLAVSGIVLIVLGILK